MTAQVLSFFQRSPRYAPQPADWTQQELAEFYRVESALMRAGIRVGTDRGLSDENEPWFVFYRSDDGEVVIHFARIDGEYLIAGPAYEEIARGFDFSALVRNMVARHPLIRRSESGSNLSIHPAALLVAVVGTAFFKTGEARAAETGATNAPSSHARPVLLSSSSNAGLISGAAPIAVQQTAETVQLPVSQAVLIMAAAMFASEYHVSATGLDASAQAAISAAAASLDFGAAGGVSSSSDASVTLPVTTHAAIVDATPAQAVSSVLSLVAVLSSLPHASDAPAPTESLLAVNNQAGSHEVALAALPSPSEAVNWTIDVRLGASLSGLPSIEAVQLVRGLLGDTNVQKISIIEVAKLPDILADLIAKADHYNVAPATTAPTAPLEPAITDPTSTTPTTPTTEVNNGGSSLTPSTPPAVTDTTHGSTTTDTGSSSSPFVSPDLVRQFIEFFVAHTSSIEVMVQGQTIVMFDANILHDGSAATHLMAMHFEFADGGAIDLVGNHSSFPNDGILI